MQWVFSDRSRRQPLRSLTRLSWHLRQRYQVCLKKHRRLISLWMGLYKWGLHVEASHLTELRASRPRLLSFRPKSYSSGRVEVRYKWQAESAKEEMTDLSRKVRWVGLREQRDRHNRLFTLRRTSWGSEVATAWTPLSSSSTPKSTTYFVRAEICDAFRAC